MIKLKNILSEQWPFGKDGRIQQPHSVTQGYKKSVNWKYTVPEHKDFTINKFNKILPPPPFNGDFGIWYDQMGSNFKPRNKSNPKYAVAANQFFKDLQSYNKAKATWLSTVTDKEIKNMATVEFKRDKARQDAENAEKQKELENKYNISTSNGLLVVNGNKYKISLLIPDYDKDDKFDTPIGKASIDWKNDTSTIHLNMPAGIDGAWSAPAIIGGPYFDSSDVEKGDIIDFDESRWNDDYFQITIKMSDIFKSKIDDMLAGKSYIKHDMGGGTWLYLTKQ